MMQGMESEKMPLNTHKIVTNLTDAGMKQKPAEVIVDNMLNILLKVMNNLVTKAELNATKAELKADMKDLRHDMKEMESSIKTWLLGFMLTMFVAILSTMGMVGKIMFDISHLVK